MRTRPVLAALALCAAVPLAAQRQAPPAVLRPGMAVSTAVQCRADVGTGDRSRRRFCDIVIATAGDASLVVPLPARAGIATLFLDLHNRFTLPVGDRPVEDVFTRHTSLVALVDPAGTTLGRATVTHEFRTVQDLFDVLGGGGMPGGLRAIAPGPAEPVRFEIPEGVSTVSLIGLRLEELTRQGLESFDAPGRPVALASNVRVEFSPR